MTEIQPDFAAIGMDDAAVTMAVRRFPSACLRDKELARLSEDVVKTIEM